MKRRVVPHPRLPEWFVKLWIRRVDAFLDAQERKRGFNRKRFALLSKQMDI